MDYEGVMETKLRIARKVFDLFGAELMASRDYKAWFEQNADWLKPYAVFCYLKDLFGTAEHWR